MSQNLLYGRSVLSIDDLTRKEFELLYSNGVKGLSHVRYVVDDNNIYLQSNTELGEAIASVIRSEIPRTGDVIDKILNNKADRNSNQ